MAYKIYRLYSGRDSAGEFLEGKDYFLERFSSILGRGITLVYGKVFQHISRRIFKRVFGKFWLASFRKGMRGAGKRKDSSTPYGGSRMFLRKRSQDFGKTSATF